MHKEEVVSEVGVVRGRRHSAAAIFTVEVAADCAALAQHQVTVLDHRRNPHRVERLVLVGCHSVVGTTIVELELVVEPQLFAQPDDAFGSRAAQMVDDEHLTFIEETVPVTVFADLRSGWEAERSRGKT